MCVDNVACVTKLCTNDDGVMFLHHSSNQPKMAPVPSMGLKSVEARKYKKGEEEMTDTNQQRIASSNKMCTQWTTTKYAYTVHLSIKLRSSLSHPVADNSFVLLNRVLIQNNSRYLWRTRWMEKSRNCPLNGWMNRTKHFAPAKHEFSGPKQKWTSSTQHSRKSIVCCANLQI